jgi:hypothetical protein
MNVKQLIARLGRMIGLGPTSELARPSQFGTGHTGTDRGGEYLRRPRASGQSQQLPDETAGRPSMPTTGPPVDDFQSPGGDQPVPKRRTPPLFGSKGE